MNDLDLDLQGHLVFFSDKHTPDMTLVCTTTFKENQSSVAKFTLIIHHDVLKSPTEYECDLNLGLQGHVVLLVISSPLWDICLLNKIRANQYTDPNLFE